MTKAEYQHRLGCEPPAISLLQGIDGPLHYLGETQYSDIQNRLVASMQRAFRASDTDKGIGIFMGYVFGNPRAWSNMSAEDKAAEVRNAQEWRIMMTSGTLFPTVRKQDARGIQAPVLLISGRATYPFLITITLELSALLQHGSTLWIAGAGHQMWFQAPIQCRQAVESFITP